MNELQYRVNFALQVLQSLLALVTGLVVLCARLLAHGRAQRLVAESELLAVLGIQILMGGLIRAVDPAQHDAADRGGPRRKARPRADEAGRRADARQRSPGGGLAGGGHRLRARWCSCVALTPSRRRSRRGRHWSRSRVALVLGAVMIYCFWLVIATVRVLGRPHVDHVHELFEGVFQTGRWPVGIYPGLASLQRHVPRADRVRRDGSGRGGHVAARLADVRPRGRVRRCALRLHALVLALRLRNYTGASA